METPFSEHLSASSYASAASTGRSSESSRRAIARKVIAKLQEGSLRRLVLDLVGHKPKLDPLSAAPWCMPAFLPRPPLRQKRARTIHCGTRIHLLRELHVLTPNSCRTACHHGADRYLRLTALWDGRAERITQCSDRNDFFRPASQGLTFTEPKPWSRGLRVAVTRQPAFHREANVTRTPLFSSIW